MSFVVRGVRPYDWADIARIAYSTGFFGKPARVYFPDEALFAALWVGPYVRAGAATLGLVAEHQGQVVGYILGTTTFVAYRAALRATACEVLAGAAVGAYPRFSGCMPYLARAARHAAPHAPEAVYSAHLHLNLLERSRGLGAGGALLDAYLEGLRVRGVPGVQLSTTARNGAALGLYRSRGFEVLAARVTPLWRPWVGEDTEHLALGRTLLER